MTLKERISATVSLLPTLDEDTLIHYYKCSLTRGREYSPLIRAIEAERKKRNKTIKELDDDIIPTTTSEDGTGEP